MTHLGFKVLQAVVLTWDYKCTRLYYGNGMYGLASPQGLNNPWRAGKAALTEYEHFKETVDILLMGMLILLILKGVGMGLAQACIGMKDSLEMQKNVGDSPVSTRG